MTSFIIVGESQIGGRDENQDRIFHITEGDGCLAMVADGMGGHSGGALAAETVATSAAQAWPSRGDYSPTDFLQKLAEGAHKAVQAAAAESGEDPHSTLAALYVKGNQAFSVHVGDCRCIQHGDEGFHRRTVDHSLAQLHVLSGKITEAEMATHPDQSRVLSSLGGDDEPEIEITEFDLSQGQNFVLCSDGFWEIVSPEQQAALFAQPDLQVGLQNTIDEALDNASDNHDNTSAVLVRVALGGSASGITKRSKPLLMGAALLVTLAICIALWSLLGSDSTHKGGTASKGPVVETVTSDDGDGDGENMDDSKGDDQDDDASANTAESDTLEDTQPDLERVADDELEPNVAAGMKPVETALEWLREQGLLGPDGGLTPVITSDQEVGGQVFRSQLTYKGVPVLGSELTVLVKDGKVVSISGKLPEGLEIKDQPLLTASEALAKASAGSKSPVTLAANTEPKQWVVKTGRGFVYAWRMQVNTGKESRRWLIDAVTAELILDEPMNIGFTHD